VVATRVASTSAAKKMESPTWLLALFSVSLTTWTSGLLLGHQKSAPADVGRNGEPGIFAVKQTNWIL
jgi:hypothetical protein